MVLNVCYGYSHDVCQQYNKTDKKNSQDCQMSLIRLSVLST